MSRITLTKSATPSTPAANKSTLYIDTADRKLKQLDDNGVISTLNNDGLQDRNILTNGGFSIQQRMAVASTAIAGISTTTRAGQVADRWAVTASVASNLNWQQVDTAAAYETGIESRYYGSMICATAAKKTMLSQFIINAEMAHLRGKKVRVSVKTNQKVGNAQVFKLGLLQLNTSGTVDVCPAFLSGAWSATNGTDPAWGTNLAAIAPDASPLPENGTVSGSYLNITTVQTVWQKSSCVFTVPTTAKNLVVVLFADTTNGISDNLSVAEFQLTQGPDMVDYKEPPIAETLLRCQRFFCKSFPLGVTPAAGVAVATGGNGCTNTITRAAATALASFIEIIFPVQMWKTPVLTQYGVTGAGNVPWRISGAAAAAQTASAVTGLLDRGAVISSTGDAAGVVGDLVAVHYSAEAEFIT
jgi:hypothetical protein